MLRESKLKLRVRALAEWEYWSGRSFIALSAYEAGSHELRGDMTIVNSCEGLSVLLRMFACSIVCLFRIRNPSAINLGKRNTTDILFGWKYKSHLSSS